MMFVFLDLKKAFDCIDRQIMLRNKNNNKKKKTKKHHHHNNQKQIKTTTTTKQNPNNKQTKRRRRRRLEEEEEEEDPQHQLIVVSLLPLSFPLQTLSLFICRSLLLALYSFLSFYILFYYECLDNGNLSYNN